MKTILLALSLLVFQIPPAGTASLQGRVVRAGTNDPVGGTSIVLAKVGGAIGEYRTGITDRSGTFAFRNLTSGSYRVYAEYEGYLRAEHGRQPASPSGIPVPLTDGQSATNIVVTMTPTGTVTGRVLDRGKPVRNVWVRALKATYRDGQRSLGMVDYASTDDLGEYRIFGLAPGFYFLSATPQQRPRIEGDTYLLSVIPSNANNNQSLVRVPGETILAAGTVDPAAFDSDIYTASFYPGTPDATAAAPVEVRAGTTTNGIDLTIARTSAVHVRGRVLDGTTGQPAQNTNVSVVEIAPSGFRETPSTRVKVGAFDLAAVPPGSYFLRAQTVVPPIVFATVPIVVGDKDVENLTIVLRPGVTVRGKVTIDGRAPVVNDPNSPRIQVQLAGTSNLQGYGAVSIQPDGTFTFQNVDARDYRLRVFQGGRSPYVKAARFGTDDVLDGLIRVTDDLQGRQLEIEIGLNAGVLDALVVDNNQQPVPGVVVAAVPDATAKRNRSDLYRTATTDATGRVHIEDMVPGDYKLFASGNVESTSWQDPDVIRAYESQGVSIRIGEGDRRDLTLKVLR